MTIKNLFNIILKVIGIIVLKDLITIYLTQILITLSGLFSEKDLDFQISLLYVSTAFVFPAIYIILSYFLIFKSNTLIGMMKLEKDFSESPINLNFDRTKVLSIAIFLITGYMIVNELSFLINTALHFYVNLYSRSSIESMQPNYSDKFYTNLTSAIITLLLAIFVIIKNKTIVDFIDRKTQY
jgi:hypothetical protein